MLKLPSLVLFEKTGLFQAFVRVLCVVSLLGCDIDLADQPNYCLISTGLYVSPLGGGVSAIRFTHQRIP